MTDAWAELLARPSWRGELAGYTGTAVLEEADEDARTARLRWQGTRDGITATATLTAVVHPSGGLELRADVHPGHGSDLTAAALVAAARQAWAPVADDMPAGGEVPAPVVAPATHAAAARRRRALVAAGAAAAIAAWALKGRR